MDLYLVDKIELFVEFVGVFLSRVRRRFFWLWKLLLRLFGWLASDLFLFVNLFLGVIFEYGSDILRRIKDVERFGEVVVVN